MVVMISPESIQMHRRCSMMHLLRIVVLLLGIGSGILSDRLPWLIHLLDTTSYSYSAAAPFDVSLYVENIYGCGDTITKQLIVQPYYNLMDTIVMPAGYQKNYFDDLESAVRNG